MDTIPKITAHHRHRELSCVRSCLRCTEVPTIVCKPNVSARFRYLEMLSSLVEVLQLHGVSARLFKITSKA